MMQLEVQPDMCGYGFWASAPNEDPDGGNFAHGWTREEAITEFIYLTRTGYYE